MNTLLLSSYFSVKKHPNDPGDNAVVGRMADGRVPSNEIKYIKTWYDSVKKLNIRATLFHDDLSDDFVKTYQTDKILFKKVRVQDYSNNDFRFFCFKEYLEQLEDKPEVVFHNDASDVIVVKDPYELVKSNSEVDYFCCRDSIMINQFPYMNVHDAFNWNDSFTFRLNYNNWELINMGVIGGNYNNMFQFYNKFVEVRSSMQRPEFNADMWVLQYLLRSVLQPRKLLIGDPVCSEFKKYQNDRKDVYFIHK